MVENLGQVKIGQLLEERIILQCKSQDLFG